MRSPPRRRRRFAERHQRDLRRRHGACRQGFSDHHVLSERSPAMCFFREDFFVDPSGLPDWNSRQRIGGHPAQTFENTPQLWLAHFPRPQLSGHKYDRGHAVVASGPSWSTGAARLAARGALRAGAGLVTIASPREALSVNAASNLAVMVRPVDGAQEVTRFLPIAGSTHLRSDLAWASARNVFLRSGRSRRNVPSCSTPTL